MVTLFQVGPFGERSALVSSGVEPIRWDAEVGGVLVWEVLGLRSRD